MPFETLCSIDIDALGKRDLKALCIKIREVWGKPIDLRSNCEALRQYIDDYRNSITLPLLAQLEQEVVICDGCEKSCELVHAEDYQKAPAELSNFEGIEPEVMGDWWLTCPLACDVNNYQTVTIPRIQKNEVVTPVQPTEQEQFIMITELIADCIETGTDVKIIAPNAAKQKQVEGITNILTWAWHRKVTYSAGALLSLLYQNPNLLTTSGLNDLLKDVLNVMTGVAPVTHPKLDKKAVSHLADLQKGDEVFKLTVWNNIQNTTISLRQFLELPINEAFTG